MVISQLVTHQNLELTPRAENCTSVTLNVMRAAINYKCHLFWLIQHTVNSTQPHDLHLMWANHSRYRLPFFPFPVTLFSSHLNICGLTSGTTVYLLLTRESTMWNISRGLFFRNNAVERASLRRTDTTLPWTWNVKPHYNYQIKWKR